jgi:hypothetical protein
MHLRPKTVVTFVLAVCAGTLVVFAGIPEPDAILYGRVWVDGNPIGATDDVTVIARVDEAPDPVGTYHMGDNPAAGDLYVLRLRLESVADGSTQSANAALIGQTARIFVQQGSGPASQVAQLVIAGRGQILNLHLGPGDFDNDGDVDLGDFLVFVECLAGPEVGTPPGSCTPEHFNMSDMDRDVDVDLDDFAIFQDAFIGS